MSCRDRCCATYATGAWVVWEKYGANLVTLAAGAQLDLGRVVLHGINGPTQGATLAAGYPRSIGALGSGGGNKLSIIANTSNAATQFRLAIEEYGSAAVGPSALMTEVYYIGQAVQTIHYEGIAEEVGLRAFNDMTVAVIFGVFGILRSN